MKENSMTEKPPTIGDNLPPFDPKDIVNLKILADQLRAAYKHKFARRDELIAAAENWKANHTITDDEGKTYLVVADDDDQAASTDQLAQILSEIDSCHGKPNSVHTLAKEPFLKGGRVVDSVLNVELAGKLREAAGPLQIAMTTYAKAKEDRIRREQQEEAQRLADIAQKAFEAAQANQAPASLEDAMQAEQDALDASEAATNIKSPEASRTYGELGTVSSLAGTWKAKVTNMDKVPRAYLIANMPVIEAAMKSSRDKKSGKPTIVIPGVEFEFEQSLRVRR